MRKKYIFYGRVQGVGFRYNAYYIARSLGVTGWVKNEYNGSVIMEAQGSEEALDRMVMELNSGRFIDISDMEVRTIPEDDGERQFEIH